jgi:hypothetical protein
VLHLGISGSDNISTTSSSSLKPKKERKINIEDQSEMILNQVVSLYKEMATINTDHAQHVLKVELCETNQQSNDQ